VVLFDIIFASRIIVKLGWFLTVFCVDVVLIQLRREWGLVRAVAVSFLLVYYVFIGIG
jgi:hypothetical protein